MLIFYVCTSVCELFCGHSLIVLLQVMHIRPCVQLVNRVIRA